MELAPKVGCRPPKNDNLCGSDAHRIALSYFAPKHNPRTMSQAVVDSFTQTLRISMPLNRIVTFLLTQNFESAISFYRDTLGFNFLRDDGFALVFDLNGTPLRIGKVPIHVPVQNTVLGWEVDDIASTVAELTAKGVTFMRYPNMEQDEKHICTFPGGDKVAWFKDPDGNMLSLSQHVC
jgi:catechol 2,3-dioxygenase-like lactoylglutathione lyase family enzyme